MAKRESSLLREKLLAVVARPLAKLCLRRRIGINQLVQAIKREFVLAAREQLERDGIKVNVNRIMLQTGLYRKEVKRLLQERGEMPSYELGILDQVIGQWLEDSRFKTKAGKPRVLTCEGLESEFAELVFSVDKYANPGTVMLELERTALAEQTSRGLKLKQAVANLSENPESSFELLARGLERFVGAVEENVFSPGIPANLHIHTEYDNITLSEIKAIREWLNREGVQFHRKARRFLAKRDVDINPSMSERNTGGGKITLCSFSYSDPKPTDTD